jgi:predicted nucleic acid-binding protein
VILLDTTVLSALMLRVPDAAVVQWLDAQPAESIWTTSITVFEIQTGLELLQAGRRRTQLQRAFEQLLSDELGGRVQSFDRSAALAAGRIAAGRQRAGLTMEVRDVEIAGVAVARRGALATRNIRHFADLGVDLVDPWAG